MAAGDVCKLPDSLLLLLRDAHSPQVELHQGSAGCQTGAQPAQAFTAQHIPLYQTTLSTSNGWQNGRTDVGIAFLSQRVSVAEQRYRLQGPACCSMCFA